MSKSGLIETDRDIAIVDAVHRLRCLTTPQIAALFFPSKSGKVSSSCRTRLRRLSSKAVGYLDRKEQLLTASQGRKPYIYFLTEKGCQLLVEEAGYDPEDIDWEPSYNNVRWSFLDHQLEINDVYIAVRLAVQQTSRRLDEWVDDRILRRNHTAHVTVDGDQVPVIPDAYFKLAHHTGFHRFFLELDRGTMTVSPTKKRTKSWRRKMRSYQAFVKTPEITEYYDTATIRVLSVTTSPRRMANLIKATAAVGGGTRYWFTHREALTTETVLAAPIWHVPGEDEPQVLLEEL